LIERKASSGNQREAEMMWTKEKPVKEGWYFHKARINSPAYFRKVIRTKKGGLMGHDQPYWFPVDDFRGWWAGPIPEPERMGREFKSPQKRGRQRRPATRKQDVTATVRRVGPSG